MANNHHSPKEMPTGDGNPTAGGANNIGDCLTGQSPRKVFATLRACFSPEGYALFKVGHKDDQAIYWAERWGLVRYLPTIDTARRFLDQIGGRV